MRKSASFLVAGSALLGAVEAARANDFAAVERGRYLTQAGNCQGCHTPAGEEPFAGSRPLETPFGVIYTPNITFDTETGLGRWTKDDFWRAMHEGKAKDGSQLYPAFPYPHFTKMPREDVDAIYAYLATLEPVRKKRPENELPFPLNWRFTVKGWNMTFFEPGVFRPDPEKSQAWNRGAYLVEGPGHCSGCHTEKNLLGADKKGRHLAGGRLENWSAPDIRAGRHGGLEKWSEEEIVEFLRTGRNAHSAAFSIMSEVISYSTQHMAEADLKAIATYLKDLTGEERAAPRKPADAVMTAGAAIYLDNCTACHVSDGSGVPRFFPPLAGSGKVNNPDPTTVIRVLLEGARAVPTKTHPSPLTMPAFGWKLDDDEIAAVATYVRSSWGNSGGAVEADEVRKLRGLLAEGPP
ncbi:c-type cytochrome [Shinella granuli]|jgi:mono/diheme cytochrome c family protein|uniref:Mono/diheme cytochrome c family protein n=1 Tax=Shinella granuli TaxID=323621 RepID=A0A4R2CXT5_SHIGR|nr:c-type cytochrome [Shinella granuli]TCN45042.1 mono/diheme cytochrome c family protein [Shinella granuli]